MSKGRPKPAKERAPRFKPLTPPAWTARVLVGERIPTLIERTILGQLALYAPSTEAPVASVRNWAASLGIPCTEAMRALNDLIEARLVHETRAGVSIGFNVRVAIGSP